MNMMQIKFRARRKDNGEYVEGNYFNNKRKGEYHSITDFSHNNEYIVYRESLEIIDITGNWVTI